MLIEFRVANFRSIRDEQIFSMVADQGTEHRDTHTFESGAKDLGDWSRRLLFTERTLPGKRTYLRPSNLCSRSS